MATHAQTTDTIPRVTQSDMTPARTNRPHGEVVRAALLRACRELFVGCSDAAVKVHLAQKRVSLLLLRGATKLEGSRQGRHRFFLGVVVFGRQFWISRVPGYGGGQTRRKSVSLVRRRQDAAKSASLLAAWLQRQGTSRWPRRRRLSDRVGVPL